MWKNGHKQNNACLKVMQNKVHKGLCGNVKGGCEFRSALFVNLEPGRHRVSLDTANFEVEIKANQKTYASCIPWMLEVVDAETGAAKIEGLSYQGTY